MRRWLIILTLGLALPMAAADKGCEGPSTFDVSPDGKRMFLSLNAQATPGADESSRLYALDLAAGRLAALTDRSGTVGWCSAAPDGKSLAYVENTQDNPTLFVLDLADLSGKRLTKDKEGAGLARFVPGLPSRLIAVSAGRWATLEDGKLVPLLPEGHKPQPMPPALGEKRAAVAVTFIGGLDENHAEFSVSAVDVVDFTDKGPGRATTIIVAEAKPGEDAPACKPLLSADGKRLVIIAKAPGEEGDALTVYEADVAGEKLGKALFSVWATDEVTLTRDGSAFLILRECDDSPVLMELLLRKDAGEPKRVLAIPKANTYLVREASPGRIGLWSLSDDGISAFEVNIDGTKPQARRLSHSKLAIQQGLADAALALERKSQVAPRRRPKPARPETEPQSVLARSIGEINDAEREAVDASLKPVYDLVNARDAGAAKRIEEEFQKVSGWEPVPGFPDPVRMTLDIKARRAAEARALLERCSKDPAFADSDRKALEKQLHDLEADIDDLKQSVPAPAK